MKIIFSWLGIGVMRLLAPLPLRWVRALGRLLGYVLFALARSRRAIVGKNLALCFPEMSEQERRKLRMQVFICFGKAWLDRSWLWYGDERLLRKRLTLKGNVAGLRNTERLIVFAPHFEGLEAGGLAISLEKLRELSFIYAQQVNSTVDQWMLKKRQRFGGVHPFIRGEGVSDIVRSIRSGIPLHLSCDMDFGARNAEFVTFFGVTCATLASLSRFAKLSKASVITLTNTLTDEGYDIELSPIWHDFPSADPVLDTQRMNTELEHLVRQHPEQYYWVHKRFKTRPAGEPSLY